MKPETKKFIDDFLANRGKDEPSTSIAKDHYHGFLISTVFLKYSNNYDFETMIFDHRKNEENYSECYGERYSELDEAVTGHKKALAYVDFIISKESLGLILDEAVEREEER